MSEQELENLLARMSEIAKAVNEFASDGVQQLAFQALISRFHGPSGEPGEMSRVPKPKHTPKKVKKEAHADGDESEPGKTPFDAHEFANSLKERPDYSKIAERLLHKRPTWPRVQLLLLISEVGLTSGDMGRVFEHLGLKTKQPDISNVLKAHRPELITSEARKKGNVPRYKLSAPAKASAEAWLNEILK